MAVLILYLLVMAFIFTAFRILFTVIHRKMVQKRYSHVFEQVSGQETVQTEAEEQPKAQTGIPREQLKKLYESGLISKEEYKAGMKKQ